MNEDRAASVLAVADADAARGLGREDLAEKTGRVHEAMGTALGGPSPYNVRSCVYCRGVAVVELSQHVQDAVAAEREVVVARLEQLRAQAARLHEIVDELDARIESDARVLRQMEELLGVAPQLSLEGLHGELRGQRLREIAIALLREKKGIGSVVHYREWFALVVDAGGRIAGKDPVATFLTQIARAPEVESVRPRSGLYRLRSA
jgi:hypothetical protein